MKINITPQFKRSYKKMMKKHFNPNILKSVINLLITNNHDVLVTKHSDHQLKGDLKDFRELHLDKDWLLIYQIDNQELTLTLINTGSHDDFFLTLKVHRFYNNVSNEISIPLIQGIDFFIFFNLCPLSLPQAFHGFMFPKLYKNIKWEHFGNINYFFLRFLMVC